MRTALSFMKDGKLGASALKVEAGHAAIRQFIDNPGDCRFLQSIKTFAASALFQGTLIYAKRHTFEDLMEVFVRRLQPMPATTGRPTWQRIVAGPAGAFCRRQPGPGAGDRALQRSAVALRLSRNPLCLRAGGCRFLLRAEPEGDATVLVADFGGGTTDYSLIRFETVAGKLTATPIGHSGVGVAGDHFDYRIIDNVVAPQIGKGSHFKSFDKILEVPSNYYSSFGRWNQLSIFKTSREFEDLKKLVRTAWNRRSSKPSSISSITTKAIRSTRRSRQPRWRSLCR
jgi:hypothetical chaperone protein